MPEVSLEKVQPTAFVEIKMTWNSPNWSEVPIKITFKDPTHAEIFQNVVGRLIQQVFSRTGAEFTKMTSGRDPAGVGVRALRAKLEEAMENYGDILDD